MIKYKETSNCMKMKRQEIDQMNLIIRKCGSSIMSLENFVNDLSKYRFTHRDIVEPLLSSLAEYLYGFRLQMDVLKHVSSVHVFGPEVQSNLEGLIRFPILDKNQNNYLDHISAYVHGNVFETIQGVLHRQEHENSATDRTHIR